MGARAPTQTDLQEGYRSSSSLNGRLSHGVVVTPLPVTVEHPLAPGPREHFHQLAVALIDPAPMLSMPTSPKNELRCASIALAPFVVLMLISMPSRLKTF